MSCTTTKQLQDFTPPAPPCLLASAGRGWQPCGALPGRAPPPRAPGAPPAGRRSLCPSLLRPPGQRRRHHAARHARGPRPPPPAPGGGRGGGGGGEAGAGRPVDAGARRAGPRAAGASDNGGAGERSQHSTPSSFSPRPSQAAELAPLPASLSSAAAEEAGEPPLPPACSVSGFVDEGVARLGGTHWDVCVQLAGPGGGGGVAVADSRPELRRVGGGGRRSPIGSGLSCLPAPLLPLPCLQRADVASQGRRQGTGRSAGRG